MCPLIIGAGSIFPLVETSGKGKSVDTVKRLVVARNFKGAVGVRRMSSKSTDNFYSMKILCVIL